MKEVAFLDSFMMLLFFPSNLMETTLCVNKQYLTINEGKRSKSENPNQTPLQEAVTLQ